MPAGKFEEWSVGGEAVRAYANVVSDRPAGAMASFQWSGVVVFHPWWGLNDDVLAYADRLADAGFSVLAPDLVRGRVAATIEDAERLVAGKDDDHADAVALAAVDRLAASAGVQRVGLVGFSMGAAHAVWAPTQRPNVACTVVYYGTYTGAVLTRAKAPVLGHFAETDPYEPDETVQAFERGLRGAGRKAEIHRYPGTGHWFAEPSRDAWQPDAANLAFERTAAFLRGQLKR